MSVFKSQIILDSSDFFECLENKSFRDRKVLPPKRFADPVVT